MLPIVCAVAAGLQMRVVSTGYSWVENLLVDAPSSSIFATELWRGELLKITRSANGTVTSTVHASGFHKLLGLAMTPRPHAVRRRLLH